MFKFFVYSSIVGGFQDSFTLDVKNFTAFTFVLAFDCLSKALVLSEGFSQSRYCDKQITYSSLNLVV